MELTLQQVKDWCKLNRKALHIDADGHVFTMNESGTHTRHYRVHELAEVVGAQLAADVTDMHQVVAAAIGIEPETVARDLSEIRLGALGSQVGGSHYKDCAIQPVEYIEANQLGFLEGCVVKRITRHNKPTGKGRQDIEKAIHELQLLLELRYCNASGQPANDNVAHLGPGYSHPRAGDA